MQYYGLCLNTGTGEFNISANQGNISKSCDVINVVKRSVRFRQQNSWSGLGKSEVWVIRSTFVTSLCNVVSKNDSALTLVLFV